MRIDSVDAIHIACYNSNSGDLIYLKGTPTGTTYTFTRSEVVDSVGSVGIWTDLSLDRNDIPYISYLDFSRIRSPNGLKMAYVNPAFSTTAVHQSQSGKRTQWDAVNAASNYVITDARTSVENLSQYYWAGTTLTRANITNNFWDAAIGYASTDYYRIVYFTKPR
jgi:hypothetical protein